MSWDDAVCAVGRPRFVPTDERLPRDARFLSRLRVGHVWFSPQSGETISCAQGQIRFASVANLPQGWILRTVKCCRTACSDGPGRWFLRGSAMIVSPGGDPSFGGVEERLFELNLQTGQLVLQKCAFVLLPSTLSATGNFAIGWLRDSPTNLFGRVTVERHGREFPTPETSDFREIPKAQLRLGGMWGYRVGDDGEAWLLFDQGCGGPKTFLCWFGEEDTPLVTPWKHHAIILEELDSRVGLVFRDLRKGRVLLKGRNGLEKEFPVATDWKALNVGTPPVWDVPEYISHFEVVSTVVLRGGVGWMTKCAWNRSDETVQEISLEAAGFSLTHRCIDALVFSVETLSDEFLNVLPDDRSRQIAVGFHDWHRKTRTTTVVDSGKEK